MDKIKKLLIKILSGSNDNNFRFNDIRNLLTELDFKERIKGSHHIFYREGITEIINIQPVKSFAKTYQVKQIRQVILKYKLSQNYEL